MAPTPLLLAGGRGWQRLLGPQGELLVQGLQGSQRGLLGPLVAQRGLQVLGSQVAQRGLQVLGSQRQLLGSQVGQRGLQVLGSQRQLLGSQVGQRGLQVLGSQRQLLGSQVGQRGLQVLGSQRQLLGSQVGQRGLQVLGSQRQLLGSQVGQRGLQVLGSQRQLLGFQVAQRGLQVLGSQGQLLGSQVGQRGLQMLGSQVGQRGLQMLGSQVAQKGLQVLGSQVGQRRLQVLRPHRGLLGPQRELPLQGLSRGFGKVARTRSSREVRETEDSAPVFQYVGERAKRKERVFVWGFCYAGALGIPSFVMPDAGWKKRRRIQPTPYRLETAEKISSAACGYGFTLISSKTTDITKVWGMGLNKDSQLGFQRSRKDQTKSYECVLEPSPIPLPLDTPQETRILQVSCGRAHSLILTDKEGVFSMGNNSYGQCGRKVTEGEIYSESHLIHRLRKFEGRVVQIVCGQDHSLFRTERGDVYSCGWGADGQTGLGHYNITSVPTKLGGDIAGVNIVQVATYGDSCLAVSDEGDLFGWGNSEYMQLASITETTQVNVPRHLPFKIGKIKDAACGGTGNAVVNEGGNVFVWGYGILGKGPNLMETATPEMIPPTLFGLSDFSPDTRVSRIRCGLSQFAALNNRGELFVWGKNIRGCLGIGRMEDQYFPWRVTVPGEVVDVACGVDHMVTLVKSFI
nr:RCC1-like G exchanging factor-like protein isoform X23 [Caretta caretta]XP_048679970.1 RCC1-like G exchanging factor-like protein isoform X25 [Caretta caretta]XP_048679972.1 RCC1-like G exchanging factor-like protein isoform X27 [Caretta caretta]XP_048679973.1 RCC1-like G exchanging factor-like protein isoform X28 [Caretta caretta]